MTINQFCLRFHINKRDPLKELVFDIFHTAEVSRTLSIVSTDNLFYDDDYFGNEFALTHSKDYLYYLARSPLSQIFDNDSSPQN